MLKLLNWYKEPYGWLDPPMLRRYLTGRLYEDDIETLLERGGKALAPEVWNYICWFFMPLPPRSKPKPTTYVRYKPKRDYRDWWERGRAELERLMKPHNVRPGEKIVWSASPA